MLQKLEVQNETLVTDGVAFDPSGSVATDLIHIREIRGLDPVAAAISMTPYGTVDGENVTGRTVNRRNIVLTVGFRADDFNGFSIGTLRDAVYRYFMPKSDLKLTLNRTNGPEVEISGIVENVEENRFVQDPEIQISILCPDPYFRGTTKNIVSGTALTADDDSIGNYTPFTYSGNIPSGFELSVDGTATSLADNWHLKTYAPKLQDFWLYSQVINASTGVRFSSHFRDRYIRNTAGASLLNRVPFGSDWCLLYPGSNLFAFVAENLNFAPAAAPSWTLSYYELYGGV